jgi:hypothetical protein
VDRGNPNGEGRKYRLKDNGKTEAVKRLFRELGYI